MWKLDTYLYMCWKLLSYIVDTSEAIHMRSWSGSLRKAEFTINQGDSVARGPEILSIKIMLLR